MSDSVRIVNVPVRSPYRLDLTATVLRRLSTNIVDVFEAGVYRRLLGNARQPALLEISQPAAGALTARLTGDLDENVALLAGRMLGADVDLTDFYAAAADIPWLAAIVTAARGVKPPQYPTVWEAIVNAVVFQQVSIHAAAAILRRVIERYEPVRQHESVRLAAFVQPQAIVDADPLELRALGLSVNKIVALRTLGRAVLDGDLDGAPLRAVSTDELAARLVTFKGIGPWTAAVIALRGFGRLDTFPMNDSGVAHSLRALAGEADVDAGALLARLGSQRGMLYYHLLIGRLAARGEIELAATGAGRATKHAEPSARRRKAMTATLDCSHTDTIRDVKPHTRGCEECLKLGDAWVHLRFCTHCGHVGCCDSSKNKHATKHFHATKHPIIASLERGENWKWCYIDEVGWE